MGSRMLGVALTALAVLNASQGYAGQKPLVFGWVTDSHLVTTAPKSRSYENTVAYQKALKELAGRNVDFVMHGGDTVNSTANEAQLCMFDALSSGVSKLYPIAGNHDLSNQPTQTTIDRWLSHGNGRGKAKREFYGFTCKGAAFYVLNTFVNETTAPAMQQRAEEQLIDMDAFFAKHASASPKIVCGHAPIFLKASAESNDYFNIKSPYRERLLEIMKKRGVTYYLAGHRHLQSEVQNDPSGVCVYCQKALSFQLEKDSRYGCYVFSLKEGKLEREFIPLGEGAPLP